MWKKWKESEFFRKMKQGRVNRVIYLSAIVILLALSVVLAITAATNRAHRGEETGTPGSVTKPQVTEPTPVKPDDPDRPTSGDSIPEFALPVSGSLSKRHSADVQVFSKTMQDYRVHLGIDINTAENAPVYAAADGIVSQIWEDPMMGWCVALTHTGDCVTVYKNLAKDLAEGITTGAGVKCGQLLGKVGDGAVMEVAEEPHLHMEVTVNNLQVDPMEYFSKAAAAALTEDEEYENPGEK